MNHFFLMGTALMAVSSLSWGQAAPENAKGATPALEASSKKDKEVDEQVTQFIQEHKIDAQGPAANPAVSEEVTAISEMPGSLEKDMIVTNDDGMFFDLEKEGVIIYYKNVKVRSKKYNLDCDNELKIYLDPEDPNKKDHKKGGDAGKADEKKPEGAKDASSSGADKGPEMKLKFKDPRRISASGNVYIQGQDKDGKNIEAKADSVVFDLKTEEMILTGGFPMFLSDKVGVQCVTPGGSIRRLPNGNTIIKGKTKTIIKNIDNLEQRRNNQAKP